MVLFLNGKKLKHAVETEKQSARKDYAVFRSGLTVQNYRPLPAAEGICSQVGDYTVRAQAPAHQCYIRQMLPVEAEGPVAANCHVSLARLAVHNQNPLLM